MTNQDMQMATEQHRIGPGPQRGRYAHLFSEYPEDEQMVENYWKAMGCTITRLDSENKRNPDFLIRFNNGAQALCEVKSFGGPNTGNSDYALAFDPYIRISNALYTGIAQLLEFQEASDPFRILFFVNHNDNLKFDSLAKLLDGEWDPIRKQFADAANDVSLRARVDRKKVDLYLWLRDTPASSAKSPSQCWGRLDRVNEISSEMRLNPKVIRLIPAA